MDSLLLELPWPPSVNHYYRHIGPQTLISREGRKYRETISGILHTLHMRSLDGDLVMTIDAYPPDKRRRDTDNILKSLFDALQYAGAYHDDSQIRKLNIEMFEPVRPSGKVIVRLQAR
jgi:Holliday junction resolvase RusA-like endonuclease